MSSSNIPRSQTGLVPKSHHVRIDKQSSPNNYRKLPPRPSPEKYPFRGGRESSAHMQSFNSRKSRRKIRSSSNSTSSSTSGRQIVSSSTVRGNNHTRTKVNEKKKAKDGTAKGGHVSSSSCAAATSSTQRNTISNKKIRHWDSYTTDEVVYQRSPKEQEKVTKCGANSLKYLRKSAKYRKQVHDLERKLDMELEKENIVIRNIMDSEGNESKKDWTSSPFLKDLSAFKASMLRMCSSHDDNSQDTEITQMSDLPTTINMDQSTLLLNQRNEFQLHDYLSIQSDDMSLSELANTSDLNESTSYNTYNDHLLLSLESNINNLGSISVDKIGHTNQSIIENNVASLEDGNESPDDSTCLWNELTNEQIERIRNRMKLFSIMKEKPNAHELDHEVINRKEKESSIQNPDNECVHEELDRFNMQHQNDKQPHECTKKDEQYLSNIISSISTRLCTSINKVAQQTKDRDIAHILVDEKRKYNDNIPTPLSRPDHPFLLPLDDGVKRSIKK